MLPVLKAANGTMVGQGLSEQQQVLPYLPKYQASNQTMKCPQSSNPSRCGWHHRLDVVDRNKRRLRRSNATKPTRTTAKSWDGAHHSRTLLQQLTIAGPLSTTTRDAPRVATYQGRHNRQMPLHPQHPHYYLLTCLSLCWLPAAY